MIEKKWGHDALAHDLAEHLRYNSARMVWEDMQMGPSGSARPDVYTMQKSFSRPRPLVYEIKVSVADFRSDVTKGKWQKYRAFSSGVVFAVPRGLIKKDDVPPGCGLIIRGEKEWRTVKGPTLGECELQQNHLLKLLIDGVDRLVPTMNIRRADDWCAGMLERAGLSKDVATAVQDLRMVQHDVERKQETAKEIIASAKEKAASIRAREDEAVKSIRLKLCDAMMLDPHSFDTQDLPSLAHSFEDYASGLRRALDSDNEIKRLQKQIDDIGTAVDRAGVPPRPTKHRNYWESK